MRYLPPPGEELASRLLTPVLYEERLSAGRLMPPVGVLREDARSLRELHLLLTPDVRSLPGVNLKTLAQWIRRVLDDDDLALVMEQVVGSSASYAEASASLYELVGQRLEQAQKVAGDNA